MTTVLHLGLTPTRRAIGMIWLVASTVFVTADVASAQEAAEPTESVADDDKTRLDRADELNEKGVAAFRAGSSREALALIERSAAIRKEVLGERHADYATSLNNLGALYSDIGERSKALPLYERALAIRKEVLCERHPHCAQSLNNLGGLYNSLGEPLKALPLYKRALEIKKDVLGERHLDYARSLHNLGALCRELGEPAKALPLYEQALAIMTESVDDAASVQSGRQQRALGQAKRFYVDSYLTARSSVGPEATGGFEPLLRWKGATLTRQRATRRWASLSQSTPGDDLKGWQSRVRELTAEKEELEARLSRRSAEYRQLTDPVSVAELTAAMPTGSALVDYFVFKRKVHRDLPLRGGIGARLKQTEAGTEVVGIIAGGAVVADGRLQADDLITGVARAEGAFSDTPGRELQDVVGEIVGEAGTVVRLRVRPGGDPDAEEVVYEITRQELPFQKTSEIINVPSLAAFVVRPASEGREASEAFFDLGPMAPIEQAIQAWGGSYGLSAEGVRAGRELRGLLWEPVLASIEDAETVLVSLDGALGLLPLGALPGREEGGYLLEDHRLAVVPVPQLIPALVRDAGRRELGKDLLLFGGIDYDSGDGSAPAVPPKKRRRFRGALGEIAGGAVWGPAATEEAFREFAPQCGVLHVATHGFFAAPDKKSSLDGDLVAEASRGQRFGLMGNQQRQIVRGFDPNLLSGLVFAGANNPPGAAEPADNGATDDELANDRAVDDGILTASEIASLPLNGVRLVVLSACETGLGEVTGGEGLLGLQRAFKVSGTRSTIASLWKVDDQGDRTIDQPSC